MYYNYTSVNIRHESIEILWKVRAYMKYMYEPTCGTVIKRKVTYKIVITIRRKKNN